MAAPKRTKFQRELDLQRITDLYLMGMTQEKIASVIGVSQPQISNDVQEIQRRWRTASAADLTVAKNIELARIDAAEREYWAAWERSKTDKIKQRQEVTGKDRTGKAKVTKQIQEKEAQFGNPAHLAGVMSCIAERCKLLGLYAPTRQEVTGKDGGAIGISLVEWQAKQAKVQAQVEETLRDFED